MTSHKKILPFLFEVGYLKKIRRSSKKNSDTSVAEHTFRVSVITLIFASIYQVNTEKLLLMALLHDLEETRIGDLDLVQQKYLKTEKNIFEEIVKGLPKSESYISCYKEFLKGETLEAKIVHDADILEEFLTEKEQYDSGELRAKGWMEYTKKRLKTNIAKKFAEQAQKMHSDEWWHKLLKE